jgi:hypothetical protein
MNHQYNEEEIGHSYRSRRIAEVRKLAAATDSCMGDVRGLLNHPDKHVVVAALYAREEEAVPRDVSMLLDLAEHHEYARARAQALLVLESLSAHAFSEAELQRIAACAEDASADVRLSALSCLMHSAPGRFRDVFIRHLHEGDPEVRNIARRSLS